MSCRVAAIVSLVTYYAIVVAFSLKPVATLLQNQLAGVFFQIFESYQAVFLLVVLPFILLVPDMLVNFAWRTFFPSPADVLMRYYKLHPNEDLPLQADNLGSRARVSPMLSKNNESS